MTREKPLKRLVGAVLVATWLTAPMVLAPSPQIGAH